MVIDDDSEDDVKSLSRSRRLKELLDQMRRVDNNTTYLQDTVPRGAIYRAELDTFSNLLKRHSLPASSVTTRSTSDDVDSYWARLARVPNELRNVECLASQTFNWKTRQPHWTVDATPDVQQNYIEEKTSSVEPKEIFTFFTDSNVAIRGSDTAAEQAVKWAQQRRLQLESELSRERSRDRYLTTFTATHPTVSSYQQTRFTRPNTMMASSTDVDISDITTDDYFIPHYVPTIVRPYSRPSTNIVLDSGIAKASDFDSVLMRPSAFRSVSTKSSNYQPSYKTTTINESKMKTSTDDNISDVRRKVRSVLAKSRGIPNLYN
jgi:hypothetical protein